MRYFSAFKAHYGTDQDLPTTPHILLIGPVVVHWRGKLKWETDLSRKTFVNDKSRKDIHNNIYCCRKKKQQQQLPVKCQMASGQSTSKWRGKWRKQSCCCCCMSEELHNMVIESHFPFTTNIQEDHRGF